MCHKKSPCIVLPVVTIVFCLSDAWLNQEIVMKMTNQKSCAWCWGLKFLLSVLYKFTKDYYYQTPINYNHLRVRLGALVDHKFQRPTLLMIRSTRWMMKTFWLPLSQDKSSQRFSYKCSQRFSISSLLLWAQDGDGAFWLN